MQELEALTKLIRYFSLVSTTKAGSGHPTSSLSATELMTTLFFGGFYKFDLDNPNFENNDRLIFSKGHASPLFYSLYAAAGVVSEEDLLTLRKLGSRLEGHPTMDFPFTEVATGSLGQGLSVGVGMALNAKYLDKLPYKTYVLLGDSEMAEGSCWEAIAFAAHSKLDNLIGILDVNRLGQRGETMYGHDVEAYAKRVESFGWEVSVIDGHDFTQITEAYKKAQDIKDKPFMIIAKTIKGKGISFLEDKDGWHGKALKQDELEQALQELGDVDKNIRGKLQKPEIINAQKLKARSASEASYAIGDMVATRKAYGNALARIYESYPELVVLDAETSNSTYADSFKKVAPERFFEMYIAEQNMSGVALGLSRRGKVPFISTFAAFFTRSADQVRMSQYSNGNVKYIGSHAGVSIGEDGASQMALEDIAQFRNLHDGVVLYPSDAVSTEKLVEASAKHFGNVYIRTTRKETPVVYNSSEDFVIGGSKVLKESDNDLVTVVGAGVTLHEALAAYEKLKEEGINIRVIDLYSIKPIDEKTLKESAIKTKIIITVEDHHEEGGLGEAVTSAVSDTGVKVYRLAVKKMPRSGKPEELLEYEEISKDEIVEKVKELI